MKIRTLILLSLAFTACSVSVPESAGLSDSVPGIFPDYTDVVIPANIAPLNFRIEEQGDRYVTLLTAGSSRVVISGPKVIIPSRKWEELKGNGRIEVQVFVRNEGSWTQFRPFSMEVSDEIDPYISYRIIPVAVEAYEKLTIRQRDLTSYKEKVIVSNTMVQTNQSGTCINCHYYRGGDTDNMMFHVRQYKGGTILVLDGKLNKVNMKTDSTISAGVYPAWHPTHDYIALSNNKTHQSIHSASHDKLEVLDEESDLILYDTRNNTVSVIENDVNELECFPGWAPDGRTLYYVSAHYEAPFGPQRRDQIFRDSRSLHFNLYSKPFDPDTRTWGKSKVVYDAVAADSSMTWPRVSPDGRWLLCCVSTHGVFPLDQIASDLYLFDLKEGTERYAQELNSPFAESYHAWSTNGKWVMFSTRREDGIHTRVYFSHIDDNGQFSKPIALPQRDPDHSKEFLFAYNIPEFMTEPVHITPRQFASFISGTDAVPAKYESKKENDDE